MTQILLDASDGASDYGNKFGEPLIQGFTRTFGLRLPGGERREWLKPIMFSGGIGQVFYVFFCCKATSGASEFLLRIMSLLNRYDYSDMIPLSIIATQSI